MDNNNSSGHGGQGSHQQPPALGQLRPSMTDELKKQIIKDVTVNLISPKTLAGQLNLPVQKIRRIIKGAGHKLPDSYKAEMDNIPET